MRLKFLADVVAGQSPPSEDVAVLSDGIPFLQGNAEFGDRHPTPKWQVENPPKRANEGDILISVRAPVGALNVANQSLGIGRGLAAVRAVRCDPGFLWWWFHTQVSRLDSDSIGTTFNAIVAADLRNLEFPAICFDEQRVIADYLDRETAQIDALVAKQKEFTGLLRERRRTVVPSILSEAKLAAHHPDKLHRRTRMGNGSTPRSGEDRYYADGTIPWVNSSVVNVPEVWEPSKRVTQTAVDECHLPMVKSGSILVALTGQGKTRGAATILRISSTINQHLAFIEPDRNFWLPEYLLWVLRSKYDDLRRISSENGATRGGLTVGDLRDLKVPMPSLDEQSRLVSKLEDAVAKIDTLIAKAQEHIALAKERRAALITAAVTGQLDVRTAGKAG